MNHPFITNDASISLRVYPIDFTEQFVQHPNPNDPHQHKRTTSLAGELKEEASGILAWLVRGYMMYLQEGIDGF